MAGLYDLSLGERVAQIETPGYVPLRCRPHAVYRCYDSGDVLLYVGMSFKPDQRLDQHRRTTEWAKLVASIEVEWYGNRDQAEQVEHSAILNEKPVANVKPGAASLAGPLPNPDRQEVWAWGR